MINERTYPKCAAELPGNEPEGLCVAHLLADGKTVKESGLAKPSPSVFR
jgi:hypothetical protein